MSGRETVLAAIRRNLQAAGGGPPHHAPVGRASGDASVGVLPEAGLVDRFTSELTALGGQVHRVADAPAAAAALLAVCREHGATRVLSWDAPSLAVEGVCDALAAAGIEVDLGDVPAGAGRAERLAVLDGVRVGVTGAFGAIAESGTIALVSGPGRSRLASLLPPVHVALVPIERLCPSLPALLAAHPAVVEDGSNLVLVTGPSRTADIEMTLTRGVHGPGTIHVVIVG